MNPGSTIVLDPAMLLAGTASLRKGPISFLIPGSRSTTIGEHPNPLEGSS